MNLLNVFPQENNANQIGNRREVVSRYKHLREVGRNLNSQLVARLSKDVLYEGGKKLGILRRGVLFFNSEDESSVLMDYCIYNVRRRGRNAIEQYLVECPPDPESDEMTILRAMQHATYSLFVVESVERGFGITVRDLLSNKILLVVDIGLGSTAQPGLVFASRLLFYDGFSATGGAALPVAVLPTDQLNALTRKLGTAAPNDEGYFDPAPLIRACLRDGCSSQVQYQEPTGDVIEQQPASSKSRSPSVGRNARCPCGSGRKFKHCCMKSGRS